MKQRKRSAQESLPIIGWREWLSLPGLGVERIKAKVDTGARSSALHVSELEYVEHGGREHVRFRVHPLQRKVRLEIEAQAPLHGVRRVRSSDGRVEERPVIVTTARLMEREFPIELTLTSRDLMGFRMLLGRQAIRARFTVDPARSYYDRRIARQKRTRYEERES